MAKRVNLNLSDDLHAAAELLRKRNHYRTLPEYFAALARYDGQSQRKHHLTAEWAALSPHERDALDAAILRQVQSGEGLHGSWLEARIEAIVQKHLEKHAGQAPSTQQVANALAQDIAEQKPGPVVK